MASAVAERPADALRPTPVEHPRRLLLTVIVALVLAACGAESPARAPAAGGPSLNGSGCPGNRLQGFAVGLGSDTGGAASPEQAAEAFVGDGSTWAGPGAGWRVVERDGDAATVGSGQSFLHAVQGPDATWQVDGGHRCE